MSNNIGNNIFNLNTIRQDATRLKTLQEKTDTSANFKSHLLANNTAKKAAQAYEAVYANSCIGTIFEHINMNPFGEETPADSIYKNLWVAAMCEDLSKSNAFGIAKIIEQEIIKHE